MRALDLGPAHLPEGLFAAGRERALLGMKVHANTISHARLVALEDTFPRTRTMLGHEMFNRISRDFLDWPGVTSRPLARIGETFPSFIEGRGDARDAAGLAAFEWLWLEAYLAADAPALTLADLAGIGEDALLGVVLARHPAARLAKIDPSVRQAIGAEVPGLCNAHGALLTRPEAQVLISPATPAMSALFAQTREPAEICNLLESRCEPESKDLLPTDDIMAALTALMDIGALKRVG